MANDVVLVPIGRIPLSANNQDLAGCERVDVTAMSPTTFHAGPGFTDYTRGREQTRFTLVFAVFAQKQEFLVAIGDIPIINGARRFSMTYQLGSVVYLCKRCQLVNEHASGDEIAGNGSLTLEVVCAERIPQSV